jgi:hypothetical protein
MTAKENKKWNESMGNYLLNGKKFAFSLKDL